MLTTFTRDSKRSEDIRAGLAAFDLAVLRALHQDTINRFQDASIPAGLLDR